VTQLTSLEDDSTPLPQEGLARLQTLLYYPRALDYTLRITLSHSNLRKHKEPKQPPMPSPLSKYCATHPDAVTRFHANDMCLHLNSNASYNSECKAKSRSSGYSSFGYLLETRPLHPIQTQCCPRPFLHRSLFFMGNSATTAAAPPFPTLVKGYFGQRRRLRTTWR
jgi:hypothetical protein